MPAKKADEETFEVIKSWVLDDDNSRRQLSKRHQDIYDRWNFADDLLRKYPSKKHVANAMKTKFGIQTAQAYRDIAAAQRLFNVMHPVNKDWLKNWLFEDIILLMTRAKGQPKKILENGQVQEAIDPDNETWGKCHDRLIKLFRLDADDDTKLSPEIFEQQNFFTVINIDNRNYKIELNELMRIPVSTRKKLTDALHRDINIEEAMEIMES